ncbi:MAG: glycosyltransferase family 4 protein [Deltaproteobacteria bacterium]|nr:glycosyltransferase family 4 protein [Deltaproteobacteria bacterium]
MNILNVGQNFFIRGGSDKYQFAITELLENKGHRVVPFAALHSENLPTPWQRYFPQKVDFDKPKPIDIFRYLYSVPAAKCMSRLLQDVAIDIAHLHIYYGQLTASILRPLKSRGIPIVQTLHEYKLVCPTYSLMSNGRICEACQGHAFWKAIWQRCNRGSVSRSFLSSVEAYISRILGSVSKIDHFISVSEFQRRKFIELGIPEQKITTVHNFVDCHCIRPSTSHGEHFLYFGRLERYKGVFTLLKAAADIRNVPLYIVGSGKALPEMYRWTQKRQLSHIRFLGFTKGRDLDNLIRQSICAIVPSLWYETFGLTIIETFAHGRPVIASRIGGITEIISDGEDGFLVSPGDAAELRVKLVQMAADNDLAMRMGHAARKKVQEQFSPEIHYKNLMSVYNKILKQHA